jgi:hypothetical protein
MALKESMLQIGTLNAIVITRVPYLLLWLLTRSYLICVVIWHCWYSCHIWHLLWQLWSHFPQLSRTNVGGTAFNQQHLVIRFYYLRLVEKLSYLLVKHLVLPSTPRVRSIHIRSLRRSLSTWRSVFQKVKIRRSFTLVLFTSTWLFLGLSLWITVCCDIVRHFSFVRLTRLNPSTASKCWSSHHASLISCLVIFKLVTRAISILANLLLWMKLRIADTRAPSKKFKSRVGSVEHVSDCFIVHFTKCWQDLGTGLT